MRRLLLLSMLLSINCLAQQATEKHYGAGVRFNRYDVFTQISRFYTLQKIEHECGAGVGTVRTFFQQRIYPEIFYRLNYRLLSRKNWAFGPNVAWIGSTLEINAKTHARHYFQEALFGVWLEGGNNLKVRLQLESGLQIESLNQIPQNKYQHHKNLGYSAQISFRYAF